MSQQLETSLTAGELYQRLHSRHARFVASTGEVRELPSDLNAFLAELLDAVEHRKPVTLLQDQTTLSTIQASEVLGVSRQFFVGLLERGDIPFHLVGTHRRVYAQDLFSYKARRDAKRAVIIRELAQTEQREGLYDIAVPVEDGGNP